MRRGIAPDVPGTVSATRDLLPGDPKSLKLRHKVLAMATRRHTPVDCADDALRVDHVRPAMSEKSGNVEHPEGSSETLFRIAQQRELEVVHFRKLPVAANGIEAGPKKLYLITG